MLVEIKPGVIVPTDKEVVAVNLHNDAIVGYLHKEEDYWVCDNDHENLRCVTHFITVENLLKTK